MSKAIVFVGKGIPQKTEKKIVDMFIDYNDKVVIHKDKNISGILFADGGKHVPFSMDFDDHKPKWYHLFGRIMQSQLNELFHSGDLRRISTEPNLNMTAADALLRAIGDTTNIEKGE